MSIFFINELCFYIGNVSVNRCYQLVKVTLNTTRFLICYRNFHFFIKDPMTNWITIIRLKAARIPGGINGSYQIQIKGIATKTLRIAAPDPESVL